MTHILFALIVIYLVCLTIYIKRKTKELDFELKNIRHQTAIWVVNRYRYNRIGGVYKNGVYD